MKIFGRNFVVKKEDLTTEGLFGQINMRDQVIRVEEKLHREMQMETVLHELIEAVIIANEITLDHPVLSALDAGLFAILIDNGIDLSPLIKEIV